MPNSVQRSALVAISRGYGARQVTVDALIRKGYVERTFLGCLLLTEKVREFDLSPGISLPPGTFLAQTG